MSFRRLTDQILVAGQILPVEVAEAAAQGVTMIVNNRPDGEEPGQPAAAEIEAAARAAGLAYRHIPVAGGFRPDDVAAMAEALDGEKALIFCKSGTRSTFLWALAARQQGMEGAEIFRRGAEAGYDLSPLWSYLSG